MTISDVMKQTLRGTHYELWELASISPTVRCKCGFYLGKMNQNGMTYLNRRGIQLLPLADPHFFEKLHKLLNELHIRENREYGEYKKKTKRR